MKKLSLVFLCAIVLGSISCKEDYPDLNEGLYAEFKTNKGDFIAELYYQQTPITVGNFVSLAEGKDHKMVDSSYNGKKFYDGLIFHRVIKDFMIQGGDPTGTGSGDPGYKFPDEIVDSLQMDGKGYLSMANAGPNTNGSQFFITLAETPWLNGKHTVFGKIVEGQAVVDSIGVVPTAAQDKPVDDVVINQVNIIRKGKEAKDFDAKASFENGLAEAQKKEIEKGKEMADLKQANQQELESYKGDVEELENGLKIHYIEKGKGEKPQVGQTVSVDYIGYFEDGSVFDTSMEEVAVKNGVYNQARKEQFGYKPMATVYGPDAQLIPGFREGISQLSVGDHAILFIPSPLGYGERGFGGLIPPNANLIFNVKLLGIEKNKVN